MQNKVNNFNFLISGNIRCAMEIANTSTVTDIFDITGAVDHYNDCHSDDFRLVSSLFSYDDDTYLIAQLGYELIELFNSAYKIIYPQGHIRVDKSKLKFTNSQSSNSIEDENNFSDNFHTFSFKIEELLKDNTHIKLQNQDSRFSIFDFCHDNNLVNNIIDQLSTMKTNSIFYWLLTSLIREDIYIIFKLVADIQKHKDDWSQLYKIWETIYNLREQTSINIQVDQNKIKEFKKSANNFSLTGLNSRHGYNSKKVKHGGMDYNEALSLVIDLAKSYFEHYLAMDNVESFKLTKVQ